MNRYSVAYLFLLFTSLIIYPQDDIPPKREFRAVWIATVIRLDWPASPVPSVQQNQFISMLDNLKSAGINAVIVQVRPAADAFYAGSNEPWSEWLTSKQGTAPSPYYDPLLFMINETHKRGMEFHAWFNPFRAVFSTATSNIHPFNVSVKHPEWVEKYGLKKILNPGLPDVRNYIINVIMDVVKRYDIDGVHLDDYFYPYPEKGQVFNDEDTFIKYSRGIKDKGDWRRDNVNLFISMLHDNILAVKPYVKFGVSPFGKWKPEISTGFSGFSSYSDIYCDPVTWLKRHDVDYIAPQLYWKNDNVAFNQVKSGYGYFNLMTWWASQTNGRHLYTGNAIYKMLREEGDWKPSEVLAQINQNRNNPNVQGNIQFRAEFLINNIKGFRDSLINNQYKYPALPPVMKWKDSISPLPVKYLDAYVNTSVVTLKWDKPGRAVDDDTAYAYVIYRFDNNTEINIDNPVYIKEIETGNLHSYTESNPFNNNVKTITYIVTSLDRLHNESAISSVTLNSSGAIAQDIISRFQNEINLLPIYTDPFKKLTEVKFTQPTAGYDTHNITLGIYDLIGIKEASIKGKFEPGTSNISFDIRSLQSGVYISQLTDRGKILERKLLVVQ